MKMHLFERVHYTGDMANPSGDGRVTCIHPPNDWGGETYSVLLEDGREMKRLPAGTFDKSPGQRFMAEMARSMEINRAFAMDHGEGWRMLTLYHRDEQRMSQAWQMSNVDVEARRPEIFSERPDAAVLGSIDRREYMDVCWLRVPKDVPIAHVLETFWLQTQGGVMNHEEHPDGREVLILEPPRWLDECPAKDCPEIPTAWLRATVEKAARSSSVDDLIHDDTEDRWHYCQAQGFRELKESENA